jgi:hypothetical protein
VIHLPAGEARCELWHLDIGAGWRAFATAMEVRAWRQRRDLAEPLQPQLQHRSLPAQRSAEVADEGDLVAADVVEALRDRVQTLDGGRRGILAQLVAEAAAAGVDFRPSLRPTARRVAIHQAAMTVAEVLDGDDDVTRSAVALVCGSEPQASVPLGAVVGSLTASEALRLHGLLVELDVGQRRLVMAETGPTFPPIEP